MQINTKTLKDFLSELEQKLNTFEYSEDDNKRPFSIHCETNSDNQIILNLKTIQTNGQSVYISEPFAFQPEITLDTALTNLTNREELHQYESYLRELSNYFVSAALSYHLDIENPYLIEEEYGRMTNDYMVFLNENFSLSSLLEKYVATSMEYVIDEKLFDEDDIKFPNRENYYNALNNMNISCNCKLRDDKTFVLQLNINDLNYTQILKTSAIKEHLQETQDFQYIIDFLQNRTPFHEELMNNYEKLSNKLHHNI